MQELLESYDFPGDEIPFVSEDYVLRMAIATQIDIMAAIIDLGDKELIKKRAKKVGFTSSNISNIIFEILHCGNHDILNASAPGNPMKGSP